MASGQQGQKGIGVLGLSSWEPLRKPGDATNRGVYSLPVTNREAPTSAPMEVTEQEKKVNKLPDAPAPGRRLLAKHSYAANPNSPYKKELNLKVGDQLVMVGTAPDGNPHWWNVKQLDGDQEGFVPATYVQMMEEKIGMLPWLQNKELEKAKEIAPINPVFKPYQATYDITGEKGGTNRYECKLCCKFFNGPQPYKMHMTSKAHLEEVEMEKERERLGV